jgi:hypothetical protein
MFLIFLVSSAALPGATAMHKAYERPKCSQ